MTKEEITQAAIECLNKSMVWKPHSSYENAILKGFYNGVEWTQKQMQGTNEGETLLYAVTKTAERTKREMIEKAAEWMRNFKDGKGNFPLYDYVGNFKQAMQDESRRLD